jgi:hypothetical protein
MNRLDSKLDGLKMCLNSKSARLKQKKFLAIARKYAWTDSNRRPPNAGQQQRKGIAEILIWQDPPCQAMGLMWLNSFKRQDVPRNTPGMKKIIKFQKAWLAGL